MSASPVPMATMRMFLRRHILAASRVAVWLSGCPSVNSRMLRTVAGSRLASAGREQLAGGGRQSRVHRRAAAVAQPLDGQIELRGVAAELGGRVNAAAETHHGDLVAGKILPARRTGSPPTSPRGVSGR